jgi:hypothetical protein
MKLYRVERSGSGYYCLYVGDELSGKPLQLSWLFGFDDVHVSYDLTPLPEYALFNDWSKMNKLNSKSKQKIMLSYWKIQEGLL